MGFRHIFCLQSHAFSESLLRSVFSAEHFHDSPDLSLKKATSYLAVINPLSSIFRLRDTAVFLLCRDKLQGLQSLRSKHRLDEAGVETL